AGEQAWATHMLLVSWVRFGTGLASTGILCAVGGIPDEGPAGKCVGTGAVYSAAFFQESEMSGGLCGGHVSCVYAHVVPLAALGHPGGDLPQGGGSLGVCWRRPWNDMRVHARDTAAAEIGRAHV